MKKKYEAMVTGAEPVKKADTSKTIKTVGEQYEEHVRPVEYLRGIAHSFNSKAAEFIRFMKPVNSVNNKKKFRKNNKNN